MSQVGYKKKTVKVDNREFLVQLVPFDNGNFISITEGKEKIGAMVVSIGSGTRTSTATVIPSKSESLFLKMVSERIASISNGICVVSLNTQKELGLETMKTLMNEIMEIVK
ncbi:MAG TPA: hypothetical protein VJJ01_02375 [Nitrosopumilaceae archaeon]|jgi:hypothetical protein|nr:hypothetical protein [Nitrosopumilaceae archaeon]